jgi:hypothetical protein
MYSKVTRYALISSLIIIVFLIPLIGAGCESPVISGTIASELAATMVPDVNLDIYLYIKQEGPTTVPKDLINSPTDIKVDSLAIWGLINDTTYSIGGALTFTNAGDASNVYSQLPEQADIWSKLSDRTIYLVRGSGGPTESLKSAISNNNFKHYDDSKALSEVALMPYGSPTKPAAVGIIKPGQAAVNLLKPYIDAKTAATIDSILTWAKPQVIVIGLYAPQQIDIADIAQRVKNNTIWHVDLGVAASINSAFPGFIVSPIATRMLDNNGYTKVNVGNLTVYKVSLDVGNGRTIPVLINVDSNHVFVTASWNESYAQTIMTSINR